MKVRNFFYSLLLNYLVFAHFIIIGLVVADPKAPDRPDINSSIIQNFVIPTEFDHIRGNTSLHDGKKILDASIDGMISYWTLISKLFKAENTKFLFLGRDAEYFYDIVKLIDPDNSKNFILFNLSRHFDVNLLDDANNIINFLKFNGINASDLEKNRQKLVVFDTGFNGTVINKIRLLLAGRNENANSNIIGTMMLSRAMSIHGSQVFQNLALGNFIKKGMIEETIFDDDNLGSMFTYKFAKLFEDKIPHYHPESRKWVEKEIIVAGEKNKIFVPGYDSNNEYTDTQKIVVKYLMNYLYERKDEIAKNYSIFDQILLDLVKVIKKNNLLNYSSFVTATQLLFDENMDVNVSAKDYLWSLIDDLEFFLENGKFRILTKDELRKFKTNCDINSCYLLDDPIQIGSKRKLVTKLIKKAPGLKQYYYNSTTASYNRNWKSTFFKTDYSVQLSDNEIAKILHEWLLDEYPFAIPWQWIKELKYFTDPRLVVDILLLQVKPDMIDNVLKYIIFEHDYYKKYPSKLIDQLPIIYSKGAEKFKEDAYLFYQFRNIFDKHLESFCKLPRGIFSSNSRIDKLKILISTKTYSSRMSGGIEKERCELLML